MENRTDIITTIINLTGGNQVTDFSLYDKYTTSQLKAILDDIKTVRIKADKSIYRVIILGGIFIILGIAILK